MYLQIFMNKNPSCIGTAVTIFCSFLNLTCWFAKTLNYASHIIFWINRRFGFDNYKLLLKIIFLLFTSTLFFGHSLTGRKTCVFSAVKFTATVSDRLSSEKYTYLVTDMFLQHVRCNLFLPWFVLNSLNF